MAINRPDLFSRKSPKKFWFGGLFVLSALLILTFQNCSQPTLEGGLTSGKMAGEQAKNLDFSYDATIDQIAYMSCSYMNNKPYDTSVYFTFRAGAYRLNNGIKIKDKFFSDLMNSKNPDAMAQLLTESPANTMTIPQLAIRRDGDLQNILTSAGAPIMDKDYWNMLAPLGTDEMSRTLVETGFIKDIKAITGKRTRWVRTGDVKGARLEGTLHFTSSWDTAADVRQRMTSDNAMLTVTYTENEVEMGSPSFARTPKFIWPDKDGPKPTHFVYGRGYAVRFGLPSVSPLHQSFPAVTLATVDEKNLIDPSNRTDLGSWVCPQEMQLKIVLPEDAVAPTAATGCRKMPDPDAADTSKFTFNYRRIRDSLKTEDWWLDYERRCIIPKKSGRTCYGEERYVEYDLSKACTPNAINTRLDYKTCLAFASICYRQ